MDEYPKTLLDLEDRFSTEEECRNYLASLRWTDGFVCPACTHDRAWELGAGVWECQKCGRQTSVTAGTVFESTRKPLVLGFRVVWWVTSQKNGANALGLQRALGLGCYKTAWTRLHKLRRAMVRPGRDRLAGQVQVDETFIGGKKPEKRGRGAEGKALVVVIAQKDGTGTGRIRLKRVDDASASSLERAVQETVELVLRFMKTFTLSLRGVKRQSNLNKAHKLHYEIASLALAMTTF